MGLDWRISAHFSGRPSPRIFIPTKGDRAAEIAKLKTAGEKLDVLLQIQESEVDEMAEEFKQLRRETTR